MAKLINLNGARGTGKSTITDILKLKKTNYTLEVLHSSKLLSKMSHATYGLEINQLNYTELFDIQQNLIDYAKGLNKDVIIFDTHNIELVYQTGKIKTITPEAHIYEFGAYITVYVDPISLLDRRKKQVSVKRNLNLLDIISEIDAERDESEKLAKMAGVNFYKINNSELDSAVEELNKIIEKELDLNKEYGNKFYNNE
jgi:adenylate kinase